MADVVLVAVVDRVATVTLNRPEKRNALNSEVLARLPEALADQDADGEVDVVILTGADPAFCAGVDLSEFEDTEGDTTVMDEVLGGGRRGPFPEMAKPVIGAINGFAVTGGLEVALACDFLVASERASFSDTHARVGVMPGWGLTVMLPQAVGARRAREMSVTGNYVDAETALRWGLVNHVVPHEELLPFCRKLGADIASNDQAGVRRLLGTYDEVTSTTVEEGWTREARAARAWEETRAGLSADRRDAVIERGRGQK